MTGKQIEAAKKVLPRILDYNTPEQRRQHNELSCRRMINCCLIYGYADSDFYNSETQNFGKYAIGHIKQLGEETVLRLYNEQCEDFSKAIVKHAVYTDGEGVTYNSITWGDEQ